MNSSPIVNSAWVLTAIAYIIVIARTVLRLLKHERLKIDDYLMVIALVFYTISTASFPITIYNGTNTTVTHPKDLSDDQIQRVILGSKWAVVGRVFYMSALWTVKACLLIYYTRLPLRTNARLGLKITAGVLPLSWAASILALLEECNPTSLFWQVFPQTPKCASSVHAIIVTATMDIFSNGLIMAIPLQLIIVAHLPAKRMIQVSFLYVLGIVASVTSVIRMAIALKDFRQDHELIEAEIGLFIIIVVANAPIIHGLYRHGFSHIRNRKYRSDSCHRSQRSYNSSFYDTGQADDAGTIERVEEAEREGRKDRGRKTWRRISTPRSSSRHGDQIHRTVELVQSRKTGKMEEVKQQPGPNADGTPAFDIFTGNTLAKVPLAKIQSDAFSGHSRSGGGKHYNPRIFGDAGNKFRKKRRARWSVSKGRQAMPEGFNSEEAEPAWQ